MLNIFSSFRYFLLNIKCRNVMQNIVCCFCPVITKKYEQPWWEMSVLWLPYRKHIFSRNQTNATPITQQILVLSQTLHHHRMKSLPLSKMDLMMRSIEFKSIRNNFQSTLRKYLNKIKSSRNFIVFADKATNFFFFICKIFFDHFLNYIH